MTHNQQVLGSSPSWATSFKSGTYGNVGAFLFLVEYNNSTTNLPIQR